MTSHKTYVGAKFPRNSPSYQRTSGRRLLLLHFNATMSLLAASRRTAAAGLSRALAANRGVLAAADGASRSVVTMGRTEDTILPVSFLPCFLGSAEALPFVGRRGLGLFPEDIYVSFVILCAFLTLLLISIFCVDAARCGDVV